MFGARARLLPAALLSLALLGGPAACVKTATVGSDFALEVPGGWQSEVDKDDPNTTLVGPKNAEWVWAFYSMSADTLAEGETLEHLGEAFVEGEQHKELEEGDDDDFTWSEPADFAVNGIEGVVIEGEMRDEEFSIGIQLLVLQSDDALMVAFGMRMPHAEAKHDAAVDAMLQSISSR